MVMPCSRSACRPSTSSARSSFAPGADAFAVAVQRRQLILVDLAGIMQQATNQGAFAVVDAATGQKAQQALVLLRVQVGFDAARQRFVVRLRCSSDGSLEIPLTLFQLHRAGLIAIDHPPGVHWWWRPASLR